MMFDWASQPYNTLLLTFIFGPFFAEIVIDRLTADGMAEDVARAEASSAMPSAVSRSITISAKTGPKMNVSSSVL